MARGKSIFSDNVAVFTVPEGKRVTSVDVFDVPDGPDKVVVRVEDIPQSAPLLVASAIPVR